MAAQRIKHVFNGVVTTTDATQTTLASFALTANGVYHVVGYVVSRNTSTGAGGSTAKIHATFKRVSGTTSLITLQTISLVANEANAWAAASPVTVDNSTDTIRVRGTGVAATTIDWFADFTILMN